MQLHDAPETFFFKLWPWVEANKVRLIWGGGIVAVAAGLISFHSFRKSQREIESGEALTQQMMADSRASSVEQQSALFQKLAAENPDTMAGQRALLQSAGMLFEGRKYADAQARFQQFVSQYPNSSLAPQATLGLAASLDAQGQLEPAKAAYQRATGFGDTVVAGFAKYRLAQLAELKGNPTEALALYDEIYRSFPGSTLSQQAAIRSLELKQQPAAAAHGAPTKARP